MRSRPWSVCGIIIAAGLLLTHFAIGGGEPGNAMAAAAAATQPPIAARAGGAITESGSVPLAGAGADAGGVAVVPAAAGTATAAAIGADVHDDAARNIALGKRYFEEVWNQGRVEALDALLAAGYINHTPSTPNPPPGPAGLKPIVLAMRRAFPDLHYRIDDVIATPEAVVLRVTMTGTHRGDLFGLPPTGRHVSVTQINIEHVRDGRIAEHWRVTDELSLMKQLGIVQE